MAAESNIVEGRGSRNIGLVDVDAGNWREVVRVTPQPDQERFVAPITYYLCLCHYGQVWHPLAVRVDGAIVGYVMWAIDDVDGSRWIGGVVIDAAVQGRGIGWTALELLIARLAADPDCREVALSYDPDNHVARQLYARLGFVETGEYEGKELVARRRLR
jgi:diamine N-acetyltransferase